MTRPMKKRQFPVAIVSSTVGTALISIVAAWLVASPIFTPMAATPDATKYERHAAQTFRAPLSLVAHPRRRRLDIVI